MARRAAKKKKSKIPARPLWRGHLKLSLVTCPVAMYNAITESEDIHLHMLNPETGNRVRLKTVDAESEDELQRSDLIRGYEFQKDKYVPLTNEELDDIKVESSTVMNIEQFVEREELDPRFFERFYYVIPDGEAGEDAFAVIREAMEKSGTYAITRAVISRKERVIALRPCTKGLMGYALREETDIRDTDAFFDDIENVRVDRDMMTIAMKLVDQKKDKFNPGKFDDRYEVRLRKLIDAKLEGVELEEEEFEDVPNVVNLMDALKKSLNEGKSGRKSHSNDNNGERKSATVHKLKPKKKAAAKKKIAGRKKAAKARKRA
jgi:DNA end-binding protein Ku